MTELPLHPPSVSSPVPEAEGYVVHEFLGRGASGTVWRATQEGTLREVALKFLETWRAHELGRLRFARETEIAASLEHDGIARVFGSGAGVSGPWLAMELVDGPPLDRWAAERERSLRERVEMFSRICEAVRYAHQRGVIHRDLKPSNVLVAPDGTPKVVDFGLACWLDGPSLEVTLTRQGEVFGSLAWMPPEQAAGRWAEVDALSDVYALGAILYSLLAGSPPLDASLPAAALLAAAQSGEHPDVRDANPQTPRDLSAVVGKCLAAQKSRRYQSAAELEADAARWLAGEPVAARAAAPLYWIGKKLRRHWLATAALLTLLFSGAGLAWGYLKGLQTRERERREAQQRQTEQTARTLHEAQELVTQLLVEMRPKFEEAGHPEWIDEAMKRVSAFPWDIGGEGTGAYDPRRFHGRAALVKGDLLSGQAQWGGALNAYHDAIRQLKNLVTEHPEVPVFLEELARARIGEAMALVKLQCYHEACGAAKKALDLMELRAGQSAGEAVWNAIVDAACMLAEATASVREKAVASLEVVTKVSNSLPGETEPERMTAEQAMWHARLCGEASRLSLMVHHGADPRPAGESSPDAAAWRALLTEKTHPGAVLARRAAACARRAVQETGEGELALRQLAAALATEAETAILVEDPSAGYRLLREASHILLERLEPPSATHTVRPYEAVAAAWDKLADAIEFIRRRDNKDEFLPWAVEVSSAAIKVWEVIRSRGRGLRSLASLSTHCLRIAGLSQSLGKLPDAARWAVSTIRKFEIGTSDRTVSASICMNAMEAALILDDLRHPDRGGGEASWRDCGLKARAWLEKNERRIKPDDRARYTRLKERAEGLLPSPAPVSRR